MNTKPLCFAFRHALLVLLLLSPTLSPSTLFAGAQGDQGAEEGATTLREAFTEGKWSLSFRPRFELVDDDAARFAGRDAEAFTLRSSFKFTSADLNGFSFGVEVEDVAAIGNELYNNVGAGSNGNGVTDRPVVADPDLTEINQAWLAYDFGGAAKIKAGRFEQQFGDLRFVGAVAWRQNHQSFDALSIESDFGLDTDAWKLTYVVLDQVHTITSARQDLEGHLFDLRYKTTPGTFGLSSQWLDYDAASLGGRSLATTALNFTGSTSYESGLKWLYDLQFAQQDDYGDNPNQVSHDYYKVDMALGYGLFTFRVGTESLEGDGTTAFQTPLATLHKFNGWADRFLTTPANGLDDLYLKIGVQRGAWQGLIAYHDFTAEHSSADYGTELDAQVLWDAPWKQRFGLKLASYDADQHSVDVEKLMLFTAVSF